MKGKEDRSTVFSQALTDRGLDNVSESFIRIKLNSSLAMTQGAFV